MANIEMQIECHPAEQAFVVKQRNPLEISHREVVIPFSALDAMYFQKLQCVLAAANMVQPGTVPDVSVKLPLALTSS